MTAKPLAISAALLLLTAPRPATSAEFVDGDLYLLMFPYGGGLALVHVDPATGDHSLQAPLFPPPFWATMTYDPYRDVMVVSRGSNPTGGLTFVDADGGMTSLPGVVTPFVVATRGDGILYLFRNDDTYQYVDAQDVAHDLVDDATGLPFTLGSLAAQWDEAFYDADSNSLILANGDASALPSWCPAADQSCVMRLPLDETGTRVVGPVTSAQIDIIPGVDEDNVVGITPGPGGLLAMVVDTNSNARNPRMQLLNPVTLEFTLWAENGPYTGAASTNAGAYSTVRNHLVIFDSLNDVLREFESGEVGGGTVIGPALGAGFASESARLIEVRRGDPVDAAEVAPVAAGPPVSSFPNPFRDRTALSFRVAESVVAQVAIYDAAGRLVREFAPRGVAPGSNRLEWDGRDGRGVGVAPGIYFARVRTGATVRTTKLVRSR